MYRPYCPSPSTDVNICGINGRVGPQPANYSLPVTLPCEGPYIAPNGSIKTSLSLNKTLNYFSEEPVRTNQTAPYNATLIPIVGYRDGVVLTSSKSPMAISSMYIISTLNLTYIGEQSNETYVRVRLHIEPAGTFNPTPEATTSSPVAATHYIGNSANSNRVVDSIIVTADCMHIKPNERFAISIQAFDTDNPLTPDIGSYFAISIIGCEVVS